MKSIAVAPSEELTGLRTRKNSLLRRNPADEQALKDAEQLVRELTSFRALNPKFAGVVNAWEVELLDNFPGANPDGQSSEA